MIFAVNAQGRRTSRLSRYRDVVALTATSSDTLNAAPIGGTGSVAVTTTTTTDASGSPLNPFEAPPTQIPSANGPFFVPRWLTYGGAGLVLGYLIGRR